MAENPNEPKKLEVVQTPTFLKQVKKLHANQKQDLDKAVLAVMHNPEIGELKKGDLDFLRVYKFKMVKQLTLLGYSYQDEQVILTLITLGSHKNFYRDVKKLDWEFIIWKLFLLNKFNVG